MSDLPELRFLDEAAHLAGCGSWMHIIQTRTERSTLGRCIVEHARTLQKLAELEAENAWIKAQNKLFHDSLRPLPSPPKGLDA